MSAWNMVFRSLGRWRLRTGLTVSGIVVGVAMMFILRRRYNFFKK